MAYASLAEFQMRLGTCESPPAAYQQLTDRRDATTGNDVVGQEILDSAHGQLHAYLAKRYTVPVDVSADPTLAQFLKYVVLDLATYHAWQSHPMRDKMKESVGDAYRNMISFLNRIADGNAALPGQAEVPEATSGGASAVAFGDEPTFTKDTLKDF